MSRIAVLSSVLLAAAAFAAAGPASASASTVHLRGTAYEFDNVEVKLAGAQVRVAEDPTLGATVDHEGMYDLKVPDGRRITPYINAAGHHTIYLQTFTTDGQDLRNVNFQVPSDAIYSALAALLAVPIGADGNPVDCAIVSTFSTRDVRDVPFAAFTGYGAHGVAGATASATPTLPAPIYFNKNVIPDRAQPRSSKDGGVIWPVVPAGTYTISAQHPTTRFAPFTATCAAGRIVNANPPWGLHELGRANPATVTLRMRRGRLAALRATHLPKGAFVDVTCAGRGCPFPTFSPGPTESPTLDLRRALGAKLAGRLRAGQTLSVLITVQPYDGKLVRFTLGRSGAVARTRCVPLGEDRPRVRCAP